MICLPSIVIILLLLAGYIYATITFDSYIEGEKLSSLAIIDNLKLSSPPELVQSIKNDTHKEKWIRINKITSLFELVTKLSYAMVAIAGALVIVILLKYKSTSKILNGLYLVLSVAIIILSFVLIVISSIMAAKKVSIIKGDHLSNLSERYYGQLSANPYVIIISGILGLLLILDLSTPDGNFLLKKKSVFGIGTN